MGKTHINTLCRSFTPMMEERLTKTFAKQWMVLPLVSRRPQSKRHLGKQPHCLSRHASLILQHAGSSLSAVLGMQLGTHQGTAWLDLT